MAKECTPGQMAQNLKVTLKMTRKKVLEHLSSLAAINLRFVHDVISSTFYFSSLSMDDVAACGLYISTLGNNCTLNGFSLSIFIVQTLLHCCSTPEGQHVYCQ